MREQTINDTKIWMFTNKLCLNHSKTEFIIFGQRRHTKNMPYCVLNIDEEEIEPTDSVKSLGVILDSALNFREHISNIIRVCRFHIRKAWLIRRYLNEESAQKIMLALVMSRLDYCNSLLVNLPSKDIKQLQKVQNAAARLVTLTPKSQPITPSLKRLHWLPVKFRIKYKIATIVHKCLYGKAPTYLKALIQPYIPARNLRSATELKLSVPPVNQATLGNRAFSRAGPKEWNELPYRLRSTESLVKFKSNLKTYYFNVAF